MAGLQFLLLDCVARACAKGVIGSQGPRTEDLHPLRVKPIIARQKSTPRKSPWISSGIFPMDFQWPFPTGFHLSVIYSKGLTLPKWIFTRMLQLLVSDIFQFNFAECRNAPTNRQNAARAFGQLRHGGHAPRQRGRQRGASLPRVVSLSLRLLALALLGLSLYIFHY